MVSERRSTIRKKVTGAMDGIPPAMVLVGEAPRTSSHREIVEGMRALRKRVNAGKMSVREMIRAGR